MSPNNSGEHPFVRHLARYGVPALILVFYVTASQHFDYTPDSTYATLNALRATNIDSLWTALLALATIVKVDVLLAAKVFSLVFSCFAILFSYLIAHEVLHDHLFAMCVALSISMQAWLIQLAPTGSGLCCTLFLSLATIFFLLRNEYIIAAAFAGVTALVAWQTVGLLFVVLVDAYINSMNKNRAMKIIVSIVLVFVGVVLPGVLYGVYVGRSVVPTLEILSIVPTFSLQVSFEILLLVGAMFVGVALLLTRDRLALNSHIAVLLWIALASFSHRQMFALTVPLMIVYIFFVVQKLLHTFGKQNVAHVVAVLIATLILAYNQFLAIPAAKTTMTIAIAQADELKGAAGWLRTNIKDDELIAAPPSYEGLVQFYSERNIGETDSRFVVSNIINVAGYEIAFDPANVDGTIPGNSAHYKVWRRK